MKTPLIPISFGELFDKLTILQIKLDNLKNQNALENVKIEYNQLFIIYDNDFSKDENDMLDVKEELLKNNNETPLDTIPEVIEDSMR